MYRFYLNKNLSLEKNSFLLPANIIHHINVLRIQNNDTVILFNGDGNNYISNIIRHSKANIQAQITNHSINNNESNIKINLIQALPLLSKFELIIQKSTELGVNNIYPILTEKSKHKSSEFDKKLSRWQNIIVTACEQCNRSIIPKIHKLQSLHHILDNLPPTDLSVVLTPKSVAKKITNNKNIISINILIGPEAGFSAQEENTIIKNNIVPLNLGPRIFRTETASLVACTYVQTKFGDFK